MFAINDHGTADFKNTCALNQEVYDLVTGLVDGASVDPYAATEADRKKLEKIAALLTKVNAIAKTLTK
jgi:hypothetical protein